jgi:hypothetical protein
MSNITARERMLELLADRAIFGLEGSEQEELARLEREFPELASDQSFEVAAAAFSLSALEVEPMPSNLRSKLENEAGKLCSAAEEDFAEPVESSWNTTRAPVAKVEYEKPGFSLAQWLGWGVAAAAVALLALNVWVFRPDAPAEVAGGDIEPPIERELTVTEKMQDMINGRGEIVRTEWLAPTEDSSVSGEVVWSDSRQQGYMRFKGLEVNDSSKEQYQLWIFDETQDESTPVDGGVFDISADGEVVVPIDAKLAVKNPKMFAVTVEKPGGVVVSKREKIVALAKV